MTHYFVSYSTKDGENHARLLYYSLKAGLPPLTPWMARLDLGIGKWPDQADKAIKDCAALLLIVTADGVISDEVGNEWSQRWPLLQLADEVIYEAQGLEQARLLTLTGIAMSRLGLEGAARDRLRGAIAQTDDTLGLDVVAT